MRCGRITHCSGCFRYSIRCTANQEKTYLTANRICAWNEYLTEDVLGEIYSIMFIDKDCECNVNDLYWAIFITLTPSSGYTVARIVLIWLRLVSSGIEQKRFTPNANFCAPSIRLASCILYLPDYLDRGIVFNLNSIIWLDTEGHMRPILCMCTCPYMNS